MTTFAIIAAVALVVTAIVIFALWYAVRQGRLAAAADQKAVEAMKNEALSEKQGAVIAEQRSDDDTLKRMRNNTF